MKTLLAWWRDLKTWQKILVAIPFGVVLVLSVLASVRRPSGVATETATDAVDSVADTADAAIKTIGESNEAISGRATARADATIDAAGEPCGQFDSAADLYTDRS